MESAALEIADIMKMCRGLLGLVGWVLCAVGTMAQSSVGGREKDLPGPLKTWTDWATWADRDRNCPTPYNDPKTALRFWPSRLVMQVDRAAGSFSLDVNTFSETWVPLPGGGEAWPVGVTSNGMPLPVVEHQGGPAVKLAAGKPVGNSINLDLAGVNLKLRYHHWVVRVDPGCA